MSTPHCWWPLPLECRKTSPVSSHPLFQSCSVRKRTRVPFPLPLQSFSHENNLDSKHSALITEQLHIPLPLSLPPPSFHPNEVSCTIAELPKQKEPTPTILKHLPKEPPCFWLLITISFSEPHMSNYYGNFHSSKWFIKQVSRSIAQHPADPYPSSR